MIRILGTSLAALLGLAFGSFLNVCLSRWPKEESIVQPRSHCPHCEHVLSIWENIPFLSWILLRGRCRACRQPIAMRYVLVETATAALFAGEAFQTLTALDLANAGVREIYLSLLHVLAWMALYWILLALALLDLEHLWLPNRLTFPGILLGFAVNMVLVGCESLPGVRMLNLSIAAEKEIVAVLIGAGIILAVRWSYWLFRRREGIGLGDAKLMALLGAWLGFPGMLLAFAIGVVLGATAAMLLLAVPAFRRQEQLWAQTQLPLGTFLCIGGIISALWGDRIVAAYLHWAGL